MGERLRRRGKNRSWEGRVKDGDVWIWKSTGKHDKRAAKNELDKWERLASDPTYRAEAETTLELVLREYLASRMSRGRSAATLDYYRDKFGAVVRAMPAMLIDCTHEACEAYIATRTKEGTMQTTVKKELRALKAALVLAHKNGKLSRHPDAIIPELEDTYRPKERALTPNEFLGLVLALRRDRAAHVAWFVASAGRSAEAERSRREDHDATSVLVRGTKTEKSLRTVPVIPFFAPLYRWALENAPGNDDGTLFSPWTNVRRDLHKACAALGIEPVSPNDLRRTHATWLRNAGVEPHLIGAALGHTDGRMAERVYGRLKPAELGRLLSERTQVPLGYHDTAPEGVSGTSQTPTKRDKPMKTVPRDRIELSTRGFSIQPNAQDSATNAAIPAAEVPPRPHERHPFRGGMVLQ